MVAPHLTHEFPKEALPLGLAALSLGECIGQIGKGLARVPSFAMRAMPAATASLQAWCEMLCCFFDSMEVGIETFLNTDSLSQNTSVGPSTGMPNSLLACLLQNAPFKQRIIVSLLLLAYQSSSLF
jgi:hypothetical protein